MATTTRLDNLLKLFTRKMKTCTTTTSRTHLTHAGMVPGGSNMLRGAGQVPTPPWFIPTPRIKCVIHPPALGTLEQSVLILYHLIQLFHNHLLLPCRVNDQHIIPTLLPMWTVGEEPHRHPHTHHQRHMVRNSNERQVTTVLGPWDQSNDDRHVLCTIIAMMMTI